MSDIVDNLNCGVIFEYNGLFAGEVDVHSTEIIMLEAAKEITKLRGKLKRKDKLISRIRELAPLVFSHIANKDKD